MFLKKYKIKSWFKYTACAVTFTALVGFVEERQQQRICRDITIKIDNQLENHFIDNQDVLSMISAGQGALIRGKDAAEIDLKQIEQRLYTNQFVQKAEVSRGINGNLIVEIEQARPIARILNRPGLDMYISSEGKLLPVSEKYTARVVLLEGLSAARLSEENLQKDKNARAVFDLLRYIYDNKFWKAQIAYLQFNGRYEIKMFPQVGKQIVDFGKPDDYKSKFSKLMVFYKEILPAKGWNSYERVSLKYQNQIICE
jgi:cell division protein FtsQ